jgi:threonyl-tRNA synthetase
MLILGKREAEEGKVSVRSRANPSLDGSQAIEEFIEKLSLEINTKSLPVSREVSTKNSS